MREYDCTSLVTRHSSCEHDHASKDYLLHSHRCAYSRRCLFLARDSIRAAMFNVTGEENLLVQVRGTDRFRLEPHAPDAEHRR